MVDLTSPELLLRTSILVLPFLVLLVLFFLLYSGSRSSDGGTTSEPDGSVREREGERGPGEPFGMLSSPDAAPPTAEMMAAQADAVIALEDRLAGAEESGEPTALAHIYLALGRARVAAGDEKGALDALRSCAGLAALHKVARVHAEARIELAEAAYRAGDLTSACEHWQMARMAFLDDGQKAEGDKIDRLMRANGCPTDWVLTDF
ncbi:MAG: hypothetical protein ABL907_13375 [Hyphomicrobium sp.]